MGEIGKTFLYSNSWLLCNIFLGHIHEIFVIRNLSTCIPLYLMVYTIFKTFSWSFGTFPFGFRELDAKPVLQYIHMYIKLIQKHPGLI